MQLTYKSADGKSITFGRSKPFMLLDITDTDLPEAEIYMQKSPFQDGQTYIDNTLSERAISVEAVILSDQQFIHGYRRQLIQALSPKPGLGTLIFDNGAKTLQIKAILDGAPIFPTGNSNKGLHFQRVLLNFLCPDPYWQELNSILYEVAIWLGAFEFPLEIPIDIGIEMGYREDSLITNIHNAGDVPCGMEIRFRSVATVTNPSLYDINKREFIKINKVMDAGEVLIITTHFANKKIKSTKGGITENAFQWLDIDSTFLQLEPGDNLLRYDADDGLESLEVKVYYTPQYLGV